MRFIWVLEGSAVVHVIVSWISEPSFPLWRLQPEVMHVSLSSQPMHILVSHSTCSCCNAGDNDLGRHENYKMWKYQQSTNTLHAMVLQYFTPLSQAACEHGGWWCRREPCSLSGAAMRWWLCRMRASCGRWEVDSPNDSSTAWRYVILICLLCRRQLCWANVPV